MFNRKRTAILAIDQGTTSSRAIVFSPAGEVIALAQAEFAQIYPHPGWVEHDPEVIWATVLSTSREAMRAAEKKGWKVETVGITNQRETTVVWDRASGAPIHNAIVWQDRRTAETCAALREQGQEDRVREQTGLVLDPYFSATKIAWVLDHVDGARARAEAGELAFGTIDTWLIWKLTGGLAHKTDATNASRTSLYNIISGEWDAGLLDLFKVPAGVLPEVCDCATDFGAVSEAHFGRALPIQGVAGDQQSATVGQACFRPGEMKSTYGTGAFMLVNTGEKPVYSSNKLLTTIAYSLGGEPVYALEGSVLSAGATIQWLRDGLGIISRASEVEALASEADPESGVYLVPAFTGLGAPYWDPDARASISGLTRGAGRAEIAAAALDSTVHQTCDLLDAMRADGVAVTQLRVDGGMVRNDGLLQRMSDLTGVDVVRPSNTETTAWGAAFLAGLQSGLIASLKAGRDGWSADAAFKPGLDAGARDAARAGWADAVGRVRTR